jgi:hypothetical protein
VKTCINYLVGTPRSPLTKLQDNLVDLDWKQANENVAVKLIGEDNQRYVLAKSKDRRGKEHAMRNVWALLQVSWWTGRNNTLDSRTFVYGNYIGEVLLMCNLSGSNPGDCYYGHDSLYSLAVLITGTGVIAERYEYDVYGTVKIRPGNCSCFHSFVSSLAVLFFDIT